MRPKMLLICSLFTVICSFSFAQVPQGINYQAIGRDLSGNPLISQAVGLRATIHDGSLGPVLYQETFTTTTNQFGLFTLKIGMGTIVSGIFSNIPWSNGNEYLEMEMDPTGGTNYVSMGESQLLSVPYALYSAAGPVGPTGATGVVGSTGVDGATGVAGPSGIDGVTGAVGPTGIAGPTGIDGATGATGPSGGPMGPTGVTGPTGATGATGTVNGTAWGITGNAGTDPLTNFIGTTDAQDFAFKVNNQNAGLITQSVYANTFLGYHSGNSNQQWNNSGFGAFSLQTNTTGSGNTAVGYKALYVNTTGSNITAVGRNVLYQNTTGNENSAFGSGALSSNTTGGSNIAFGVSAMGSNTTGTDNTAVGTYTMIDNTTGNNNTAMGKLAMAWNTTGAENCAFGMTSLYKNLTGNFNSAFGGEALDSSYGSFNSAFGDRALVSNTVSECNTGVGFETGYGTINGNYCTFLGYLALASSSGYSNSMALGANSAFLASNQVRIGNSTITSIGGQVSWTTLSDGRFKTNVAHNVPGLDFILKLNPVTYNIDVNTLDELLPQAQIISHHGEKELAISTEQLDAKIAKSKITYSGFIAQEVELAAKNTGYDFSGVDAPKNKNDFYGLRYAEFVVPLVKAVQELNTENLKLKSANEEEQMELQKLKQADAMRQTEISQLKAEMEKIKLLIMSQKL